MLLEMPARSNSPKHRSAVNARVFFQNKSSAREMYYLLAMEGLSPVRRHRKERQDPLEKFVFH